jgi:hypothetical protein
LLFVVMAANLGADACEIVRPAEDGVTWAAAAALAAALGLCLWDHRAVLARAGLYGLGLTAVGLALHGPRLSAPDLGRVAGLALAGFVAGAALLRAVGRWVGVSRLCSLPSQSNRWFLPSQSIVAAAVLIASVWVCIGFDALGARLGGPLAVTILVAACLLSIGAGSAPWNEELRGATLVLAVLAAAETAWAFPDAAGPAVWLHRNVLLLPTLVVAAFACGVGLARLTPLAPAWGAWGRRLAPAVGGAAVLTLPALVTLEFRLFDPAAQRTPIGAPGAAVVAAALAALAAGSVWAAVRRGRARYVYAAEVVLALLFVHLRLNVPELFDAFAARYWVFIVMGVAFLGVALSEFFERRGLHVLAAPLQRTGVFLPLLPLLAFWVRPPEPLLAFADLHAPGLRPFFRYLDLPAAFDAYALVWLLVAFLYASLAAARRSLLFALLAALAANCGLWALLTHFEIAVLVHPQAWLIPLGLILLAAEYINRARLPRGAAVGLRYLGVVLIYVSSTADLFIAGIGQSVVLPVVLAVLAVLGMLAGVLLRVRAFLFLGIAFLALDVFTMIWHAAVDREQTWVWWASGIVLGAAILTLFAVFEKRRNDVLRVLEDVRRWD